MSDQPKQDLAERIALVTRQCALMDFEQEQIETEVRRVLRESPELRQVEEALERAASLPTGQTDPDENCAVVVLAEEALATLRRVMGKETTC